MGCEFTQFLDQSQVLFFLLNQPIKNSIPIKKAGPEIGRLQKRYSNLKDGSLNMFVTSVPMYKSPARMKAIPPTISYFQEIIKIIKRIRLGMLCMNKPKIVPQNP